MVHQVRTTRREELVDVTEMVERAVSLPGVSSGVAIVSLPHTTAGILRTRMLIRMSPRT